MPGHFTNIGQVQAQDVPASEVDPEFYLWYTDKVFCVKTPSIDIVFNLLRKIDKKKATGLDMIPSELLKIAASIVAPSLTAIFTKSIVTGIYPTDWKTARVTPMFNKGVKSDVNTVVQFPLSQLSQRFLKKLFTTNSTNI